MVEPFRSVCELRTLRSSRCKLIVNGVTAHHFSDVITFIAEYEKLLRYL